MLCHLGESLVQMPEVTVSLAFEYVSCQQLFDLHSTAPPTRTHAERGDSRAWWASLSAASSLLLCPAHVLMYLQEVAVSVVGKYRYQMYSPAEHRNLPVIVDIILVGR